MYIIFIFVPLYIMKKIKTIVIDTETIRKMEKSAHRKALIEAGLYGRPTHKIHKGVKDYTRKAKYKKDFLD